MHSMEQGYGRERDPWDRQSPDREPLQRDGREREPSRRSRGGPDPLDQRVDRWVTAGRQFVEGVAGSRPGGRPGGRGPDRRGQLRPRIDELGRWVEGRLDWLIDDGDDWREPWQESERGTPEPAPAPVRSRRPMLEAVSRRGRAVPSPSAATGPAPSAAPAPAPASGADDDWPDDDSFTLPRWRRPEAAGREGGGERLPVTGEQEPAFPPPTSGRLLPRSSRRRA